jgi:hypothetical protein
MAAGRIGHPATAAAMTKAAAAGCSVPSATTPPASIPMIPTAAGQMIFLSPSASA